MSEQNEPANSNAQTADKTDAQPGPPAEQSELERVKDSFRRLTADLQNVRKRMAQDISRRSAVAKEGFIRELLPVIDNLERALSNAASATQEQLSAGVRMTIQQLHQILRQHGIESEEALGEPFDHHRHEAVGTKCVPSQPDHSVVEVFERGYRGENGVFRPAKVVVNNLNQRGEMGALASADSDAKSGKRVGKDAADHR